MLKKIIHFFEIFTGRKFIKCNRVALVSSSVSCMRWSILLTSDKFGHGSPKITNNRLFSRILRLFTVESNGKKKMKPDLLPEHRAGGF